MKRKRKTTQRRRKRIKRESTSLYKNIKRIEIDNERLLLYYGKTQIYLMVGDPYWLYAYWEIAPESLKSIKGKINERWENVRYILRVYDVKYIDFDGTNANYWFDIEVGKDATNWYITLWNDKSSYCAEIGILTTKGEFFPFAISNCVQTPRAGISDNLEERWMDVRNDYHLSLLSEEPIYYDNWSEEISSEEEISLYEDSYSPPRVQEGLKERSSLHRDRPEERAEESPTDLTNSILHGEDKIQTPLTNLTRADIRRYYEEKWALHKERYKDGEFERGRKKGITKEGNPYLSKIRENPGITEPKRIPPILRNKIKEGDLSSDFFSSFSISEDRQKEGKGKGFFFILDKEIIIYGRTEPDAEVWIRDKKVELKKDGSFTLRYALSDEKISFPFTVVSSDGKEKRGIKIEVESKLSSMDIKSL
ncbi:MAG: DUF4912 domain-containing protein [Nitrospinae bacterium]|nr:DUF4912 domain-containing protein [Nitrospinota bacterium]